MNIRRFMMQLVGALGLMALAAAAAGAEDARQPAVYLPLVARPTVTGADCNVPGGTFARLSVQGRPLSGNVETDPDVNLGVRGYAPVDAPLQLVSYDGAQDPAAPQFPGSSPTTARPPSAAPISAIAGTMTAAARLIPIPPGRRRCWACGRPSARSSMPPTPAMTSATGMSIW